MQTERFTLEFDDAARPRALNLLDGNPLLTTLAHGDGFVLHGECPESPQVRLERLVPQGDNRLLVTARDGGQGILLEVKERAHYITFRIVELQGIDTAAFGRLDFSLNADSRVGVMELDHMTVVQDDPEGVRVSWPYLKHGGTENPYGGFALYVAQDPADEDDIILHIWVDEGLPHPQVEGPWDLAAARDLVAEWQRKYADQSQFYLEAQNPEELYEGVQYAERAGVKDIYLFTNTWHADGGFWPRASLNWAVRKDVFPRGEADLRAFSNHLESKGMHLKIHWVSGGICEHDPRYILPQPDPRLANWITGQLVAAVDTKETTLLFKPEPGFDKRSLDAVVNNHRGQMPSHVRVGAELIQVGSFGDTDAEIWTLRDCVRGASGTGARQHATGVELTGLQRPYNIVFTPDVDSTLLDEMAEGFAGLVNRCRIMNVEYDGYEIHGYAGRWGCEKFATKVYAALDHTVASNTSGGSAPRCWIEYRLNSTKELMRGNNPATHGGYSAAVMLDSPMRPASRVTEAHFSMSKAAANDSNRFSLTKPQPMFGISPGTLKQHGRTDEIIEVVCDWKEVSRHLSAEQRQTMRATFGPPELRLRDASRDPSSEIVWMLRHAPTAWHIVPVRVLTRHGGDIKWHSWQEHGPIMPRQFIKPGQPLRLLNPNPAQAPRFTVQCLSGFDPTEPTVTVDPVALQGLYWICDKAAANTASHTAHAESVHFRKTFNVPADFRAGTARFLFATDDHLELWVNGVQAGEGGSRTQMTAWDITPYLKAGENLLAVAATSVVGKLEIVPVRTAAQQREAEHVAGFEGKAAADSFEIPIDTSWRCAAVASMGWQQAEFDDSGWGPVVSLVDAGGAPVTGSIPLQPAASDMQETCDMAFADTANGLQISCDNAADERRTFEDAIPFCSRRVDMTRHRGIGLEVTGDGSGALLVIRIPGRDYLVPIDFTGSRYIEIPKGEVSWADDRWGWRVATHHADYAQVDRIHLGFGAVPGKTRASVEIRNLRALREISTQLQDPVIQIGAGTLRCTGAVQSSEYLEYSGGQTARVYDRNWNLLRDLPVETVDFSMPNGEETVTITGSGGSPVPWLDVQIMTDGTALVVAKPEA